MFFNSCIFELQTQRGNRTLTTKTTTFNINNQWVAYRYVVTEPTKITGFYYSLNSRPGTGLSRDFVVGISTSLGPNGVFPFTLGATLMNTGAGTAKTISFEVESPTFNVNSSSALYGSFINLSNEYTLQPYVPYWFGIKAGAGLGTAIFRDACTVTQSDNQHAPQNARQTFAYDSSGTGAVDNILVVPFYTNSGTGLTEYYTKYPAAEDNFSKTYNPAAQASNRVGREFGVKFELNDFAIQDWEVSSITIEHIEVNALDARLTLTVYDGTNFDNIVGIGLTLTGYDHGTTLSTNAGSWEWPFVPPLKLRTNKTYYAGIAWTQPTTQPDSTNSVILGPYAGALQTNQSAVLSHRDTPGSGALTDEATFHPHINFKILNTRQVSRSIGN